MVCHFKICCTWIEVLKMKSEESEGLRFRFLMGTQNFFFVSNSWQELGTSFSLWNECEQILRCFDCYEFDTQKKLGNYVFEKAVNFLMSWNCHYKSGALSTPTSVCIFSILLFMHFLRCWQGEFVWQSRASLVGDHFLYSHDLNVCFRGDIVRRS